MSRCSTRSADGRMMLITLLEEPQHAVSRSRVPGGPVATIVNGAIVWRHDRAI